MIHNQNLLENSSWSLCLAMVLTGTMVNFLVMFRFSVMPWFVLVLCICAGYFWGRDIIREGGLLSKHCSIISYSIGVSMGMFIFSEVLFFSSFFVALSYCLYGSEVDESFVVEMSLLNPLGLPLMNTFLLLSSGVWAVYLHEMSKSGYNGESLMRAILLGIIFLMVQGIEFNGSEFGMSENIVSCGFFGLTGFHGLHVVIGLALLLVVLFRFLNSYCYGKVMSMDCGMVYWHFVDVIWLVVMLVVYIGPNLM